LICQAYKKAAALQEGTSNAIEPWFSGFVQNVGVKAALYLLQDVGKVVEHTI
jgi:hypothetical protein